MLNRLILAGALLPVAVFAAAPRAKNAGAPPAASSHERRQALLEDQMAAEAALAVAERKAVAAVRADRALDEARQRAAVKAIRRDYRIRSEKMKARYASDQKAFSERRL